MRSVITTFGVAKADDPSFGVTQMLIARIIGRSTTMTNPAVTNGWSQSMSLLALRWRLCVLPWQARARTVRNKYGVSAGQLASWHKGSQTLCSVMGLASVDTVRWAQDCTWPELLVMLEDFVNVYSKITYYESLKSHKKCKNDVMLSEVRHIYLPWTTLCIVSSIVVLCPIVHRHLWRIPMFYCNCNENTCQ